MRISSSCLLSRLSEMIDTQRLRRSEYFPNLGLLFHREGYYTIWKDQKLDSTTNGWDHWLRIRIQSLQGECVFPVVPRVRHMHSTNSSTASKALAIRLQRYPLVEDSYVDLGNVSYLLLANYDQSLLNTILPSPFVSSIQGQMNQLPHSVLATHKESTLYGSKLQWREHVLVFVEGQDDIKKIKMYKNRVIIAFILREVV